MSEHREQSAKRRDERHIKEPEASRCKNLRLNKKHKPFRLIAKKNKEEARFPGLLNDESWCAGKYAKREDAEKALKAKQDCKYMGKYYIWHIEEKGEGETINDGEEEI